MDMLIEFLLELLVEGGTAAAHSKRLSPWIRWPITAALAAFYLFALAMVLLVCWGMWRENRTAALTLTVLLAAGLWALARKFTKYWKNVPRSGGEEEQ